MHAEAEGAEERGTTVPTPTLSSALPRLQGLSGPMPLKEFLRCYANRQLMFSTPTTATTAHGQQGRRQAAHVPLVLPQVPFAVLVYCSPSAPPLPPAEELLHYTPLYALPSSPPADCRRAGRHSPSSGGAAPTEERPAAPYPPAVRQLLSAMLYQGVEQQQQGSGKRGRPRAQRPWTANFLHQYEFFFCALGLQLGGAPPAVPFALCCSRRGEAMEVPATSRLLRWLGSGLNYLQHHMMVLIQLQPAGGAVQVLGPPIWQWAAAAAPPPPPATHFIKHAGGWEPQRKKRLRLDSIEIHAPGRDLKYTAAAIPSPPPPSGEACPCNPPCHHTPASTLEEQRHERQGSPVAAPTVDSSCAGGGGSARTRLRRRQRRACRQRWEAMKKDEESSPVRRTAESDAPAATGARSVLSLTTQLPPSPRRRGRRSSSQLVDGEGGGGENKEVEEGVVAPHPPPPSQKKRRRSRRRQHSSPPSPSPAARLRCPFGFGLSRVDVSRLPLLGRPAVPLAHQLPPSLSPSSPLTSSSSSSSSATLPRDWLQRLWLRRHIPSLRAALAAGGERRRDLRAARCRRGPKMVRVLSQQQQRLRDMLQPPAAGPALVWVPFRALREVFPLASWLPSPSHHHQHHLHSSTVEASVIGSRRRLCHLLAVLLTQCAKANLRGAALRHGVGAMEAAVQREMGMRDQRLRHRLRHPPRDSSGPRAPSPSCVAAADGAAWYAMEDAAEVCATAADIIVSPRLVAEYVMDVLGKCRWWEEKEAVSGRAASFWGDTPATAAHHLRHCLQPALEVWLTSPPARGPPPAHRTLTAPYRGWWLHFPLGALLPGLRVGRLPWLQARHPPKSLRRCTPTTTTRSSSSRSSRERSPRLFWRRRRSMHQQRLALQLLYFVFQQVVPMVIRRSFYVFPSGGGGYIGFVPLGVWRLVVRAEVRRRLRPRPFYLPAPPGDDDSEEFIVDSAWEPIPDGRRRRLEADANVETAAHHSQEVESDEGPLLYAALRFHPSGLPGGGTRLRPIASMRRLLPRNRRGVEPLPSTQRRRLTAAMRWRTTATAYALRCELYRGEWAEEEAKHISQLEHAPASACIGDWAWWRAFCSGRQPQDAAVPTPPSAPRMGRPNQMELAAALRCLEHAATRDALRHGHWTPLSAAAAAAPFVAVASRRPLRQAAPQQHPLRRVFTALHSSQPAAEYQELRQLALHLQAQGVAQSRKEEGEASISHLPHLHPVEQPSDSSFVGPDHNSSGWMLLHADGVRCFERLQQAAVWEWVNRVLPSSLSACTTRERESNDAASPRGEAYFACTFTVCCAPACCTAENAAGLPPLCHFPGGPLLVSETEMAEATLQCVPAQWILWEEQTASTTTSSGGGGRGAGRSAIRPVDALLHAYGAPARDSGGDALSSRGGGDEARADRFGGVQPCFHSNDVRSLLRHHLLGHHVMLDPQHVPLKSNRGRRSSRRRGGCRSRVGPPALVASGRCPHNVVGWFRQWHRGIVQGAAVSSLLCHQVLAAQLDPDVQQRLFTPYEGVATGLYLRRLDDILLCLGWQRSGGGAPTGTHTALATLAAHATHVFTSSEEQRRWAARVGYAANPSKYTCVVLAGGDGAAQRMSRDVPWCGMVLSLRLGAGALARGPRLEAGVDWPRVGHALAGFAPSTTAIRLRLLVHRQPPQMTAGGRTVRPRTSFPVALQLLHEYSNRVLQALRQRCATPAQLPLWCGRFQRADRIYQTLLELQLVWAAHTLALLRQVVHCCFPSPLPLPLLSSSCASRHRRTAAAAARRALPRSSKVSRPPKDHSRSPLSPAGGMVVEASRFATQALEGVLLAGATRHWASALGSLQEHLHAQGSFLPCQSAAAGDGGDGDWARGPGPGLRHVAQWCTAAALHAVLRQSSPLSPTAPHPCSLWEQVVVPCGIGAALRALRHAERGLCAGVEGSRNQ